MSTSEGFWRAWSSCSSVMCDCSRIPPLTSLLNRSNPPSFSSSLSRSLSPTLTLLCSNSARSLTKAEWWKQWELNTQCVFKVSWAEGQLLVAMQSNCFWEVTEVYRVSLDVDVAYVSVPASCNFPVEEAELCLK